jgi:hypothetical protein
MAATAFARRHHVYAVRPVATVRDSDNMSPARGGGGVTGLLDTTPRALAEGLDHIATGIGEQDGEVAAILREAQRRLEIVAWNRYAQHHNRLGARLDFVRRHRARKGDPQALTPARIPVPA